MKSGVRGDRWRGLRVFRDEVTLAPSGLLELPADACSRLGATAVLAPGLEAELRLYAPRDWEAQMARVDALPDLRQEARLMVQLLRSNAMTVDIGHDRVLSIPPHLQRLGRLKSQVLVVSAGGHVELWDPQAWIRRDQEVEVVRHGVA